jgi:hypothetical protein
MELARIRALHRRVHGVLATMGALAPRWPHNALSLELQSPHGLMARACHFSASWLSFFSFMFLMPFGSDGAFGISYRRGFGILILSGFWMVLMRV